MMSFSLSGGVEVFGFISPSEPTDTYPVIDPIYGIDGLRNVDTISDLDNIPDLRRRAGMVVGVDSGSEYYKLNPSPWNFDFTDWSVFNSSSGIYAGVISGSTNWVNNNDGTITLPTLQVALFSTSDFSGPLKLYFVPTTTLEMNNEDTNYISVDYNGGSPVYSVLTNDSLINDSNVILYLIIYRSNNFLHILEFGNYGSGLPNKLNDRVLMTDRFAHESGCIIGLSGSTGIVTLTDGVVWDGVYRQVISAVTSNDGVFFQNYHVGGNWVYTTTATTLNNEYYDDGTDLVGGTPGKYLVNWYFRGQEVNDHLYEVFGNNEFNSVPEAELSLEPLLPELITSHAFIVGRIIVEVGQTTGSTQTAFVTPFVSTQVTNHQDLLGLQGGGPGEYYHLTSNDYNSLLTDTITGATNIGTGLTIFDSVVDRTIQMNTITGDEVGKIVTTTTNNTIQVGINEENLSLWPLVVQGNRLLSGGVSYVSGLTFNVSPVQYIIDGSIYTIQSSTTVILNSGDTLYDRIDVIVADISGNTSVVQGVPSANPEKPDIDESIEVEVTFVIVRANSVTADIDGFIIYNENLGSPTEWNFGVGGTQSSRIIGSSTGNTYSGTTSIRVSGVTLPNYNTYFRLTGSTSVDTNNYATLQFALKNLSENTIQNRIRIKFLTTGGTQNGSVVYMNAQGSSGYVQYSSTNTSTWQLISIPLWRFYLTNTNVQVVEIAFYPLNGSVTSNYYFDLIEFVEGTSSSPPSNSWTTIKGDSATTIIAPNPNATLTISGGTNISSSISGSSTVVLNLDNNISLNSVSATTISGGTFYGNGSLLTGVSGGFTGGTVTGNTIFLSGVTANTITGNISFNTLPTSNNFNGDILKIGTGTTTTGKSYYLNNLGGWSEVDSNNVLTSNGLLGIAIGTNPSSDGMLIKGFANNTLFTGTTGSPLYISSSNGLISEYPPTGSGKIVRVVGYKLINTNSIFFNPDPTWVQLT